MHSPPVHTIVIFSVNLGYSYLVCIRNYFSRCDGDIERGRNLDATLNYTSKFS